MTKLSCSIRFEPETLQELLGKEAYRALIEEVAHDMPLDDHGPIRKVAVVIDGYHVRAALRRVHGRDAPELLADWLDRLGTWLADEFLTEEYGLEVYVRAWDAHLPEEEETKASFQSLPAAERVRYAECRADRYRGLHTTWLAADWHFSALRRIGGSFVQSGVDARIAADIIGMALDRPYALFLVTGDQDFELALQVAGKIEDGPKLGLLTMQHNGGPERVLANLVRDRWVAYPRHDGPEFARKL